MAIMWAIKKCRYYLEGLQHFEVFSDHKPLESMYRKDLQDVTNTRIHNFREKTANFNFNVKWVEGRSHLITDTLSRQPMPGTFEDGEPDLDTETTVVRKTADADYSIARDDLLFKPMFEAAAKDMDYQRMIDAVKANKKLKDLPKDHPSKIVNASHLTLFVF